MKKLILMAAAVVGMMTASAQQTVEAPSFWQNWWLGVDVGATTPLKGHSFFTNMRGGGGVHVHKMVSPLFGVGAEGYIGIKGASSVVDNLYVGPYAKLNLMNLFCGFNCDKTRLFDVEVQAGSGLYHTYLTGNEKGFNNFVTKAGLNFNFNVADGVIVAIKPAVLYNLTGRFKTNETCKLEYSINRALFNVEASVSFRLGSSGFNCVAPCPDRSAEIADLNAKVNQLRGQLDNCNSAADSYKAQVANLKSELAAAKNKKPEVIKEVSNTLTSVRYVFYKIGSSVITPDQQPNVEMIANYLKHHNGAKVIVKGYASQDGNEEINIKLAAARAESVKNALVNKYGIAPSRIKAEGEGIGHMFAEESWNRVSICTIDD